MLLNLFTEDVQSKWLDVNETTALLTIPFIESDIVEISENLNIQVMPLNKLQSDIATLRESGSSQTADLMQQRLDEYIMRTKVPAGSNVYSE